MPGSIALTRIHTPEDYWNRMACAETLLMGQYHSRLRREPDKAYRCLTKAQQLSDRYHEYWPTTRKDYFG